MKKNINKRISTQSVEIFQTHEYGPIVIPDKSSENTQADYRDASIAAPLVWSVKNDDSRYTVSFKVETLSTRIQLCAYSEKTNNLLSELKLFYAINDKRSHAVTDIHGLLDIPVNEDRFVFQIFESDEYTNQLFLLKRNYAQEHETFSITISKVGDKLFLGSEELSKTIQFEANAEGFTASLNELYGGLDSESRGRVISSKKMLKNLSKLGYVIDKSSGKGSHAAAFDRFGNKVIIPFHGGDLRPGTLNSILKSLGITFEQLIS